MITPRFLVFAPVGRDGELICSLLNGAGYAADRVALRIGRIGYIAGDLIAELPAALEALYRTS